MRRDGAFRAWHSTRASDNTPALVAKLLNYCLAALTLKSRAVRTHNSESGSVPFDPSHQDADASKL